MSKSGNMFQFLQSIIEACEDSEEVRQVELFTFELIRTLAKGSPLTREVDISNLIMTHPGCARFRGELD